MIIISFAKNSHNMVDREAHDEDNKQRIETMKYTIYDTMENLDTKGNLDKFSFYLLILLIL